MSQPDMEWDKMTMKQLRPHLKERGLRISGKKADRINDIITYEKKQNEQKKQQKQQHRQAYLASENDSFTQFVSKINGSLGYDGIDSDTEEHFVEQNVNIQIFQDYMIREKAILQSTFGVDVGTCWKIRQILLESKDKNDEQKDNVSPTKPNVAPKANSTKMFAYRRKVRHILVTQEKKKKIETPQARELIARRTQSNDFRQARDEVGPADVMKEELTDLDSHHVVTLRVHSLPLGQKGGPRKWRGEYDLNQLSVTYPLLSDEDAETFASYVKEKKVDLRNMALTFGIDELRAITDLGLLELLR